MRTHAYERRSRETAEQQCAKLTGTPVTCSGYVYAKDCCASVLMETASWMAVSCNALLLTLSLAGALRLPRWGLYTILFKGGATRTGLMYPLGRKITAEVAARTEAVLFHVHGEVNMFRTDS